MSSVLSSVSSTRASPETRLEAAGLAAVSGSAIYERSALAFFAFARDRSLTAGEPDTVHAWAAWLEERYAATSFVPLLAGAKKGLRGTAKELAFAKDAAAFSEALRAVKAPKASNKAVRRAFILSPPEEASVLVAMSMRDAALSRFHMWTEARIPEALGIRLEQCKAEGKMILCPVLGKGGKVRELGVPGELFELVRSAYGGGLGSSRRWAGRRCGAAIAWSG